MLWRLAGIVVAAALLASAFTPLPNALARRLSSAAREEPAEAIVVLGAAQWPDGELSDASLRRALHGIVLYRRGLAPLLVFSGGQVRAHASEATMRARLGAALGVPASAMLRLEGARTTRDEALGARTLLAPRGARRILLVSNAIHLARAAAAFERVGFVVLPAPAAELSVHEDKPEDRLSLMRRAGAEAAARVYYRLAGFL